jgi:hypothetical protein
LAQHHHWFELNELQKRALPEAQALYATRRRIWKLAAERDALAERLPATPAASPSGVARELAVVADLLDPSDQPVAHSLVSSSIRDLEGWS